MPFARKKSDPAKSDVYRDGSKIDTGVWIRTATDVRQLKSALGVGLDMVSGTTDYGNIERKGQREEQVESCVSRLVM